MSVTGYLGPEGSYSQIAASSLNMGEIKMYPSFYALVCALNGGEVDGIVLPVENSLNGGVVQNLDLLQQSEGLIAVREIRVRIEHRLITLRGADLKGIKHVYSHIQALEQCSKYLHTHLPDAKYIPTSSTSACLSKITSSEDAGIIGLQNVDPRFELSDECISDQPVNYTQFLYIINGAPDQSRRCGKVFLSMTCAHRPGALMQALSIFAKEGINMTKIESRPIKDRFGEYRFFIEVEADYSSAEIRAALHSLEDICSSLRILGCY